MKKSLIILIITIIGYMGIAQTPKERIKALKTAYITKELDLTNEEAKVFWPIYNTYDQELEDNRRKQTREIISRSRKIDELDSKEAKKFINDYLNAEHSLLKAQENLIKNLESVFSQQRIAKLLIAERTFNQRMLQRFKNRMGN